MAIFVGKKKKKPNGSIFVYYVHPDIRGYARGHDGLGVQDGGDGDEGLAGC